MSSIFFLLRLNNKHTQMLAAKYLSWNEIKCEIEIKFYYCGYKVMTHQKFKMYMHETRILYLSMLPLGMPY